MKRHITLGTVSSKGTCSWCKGPKDGEGHPIDDAPIIRIGEPNRGGDGIKFCQPCWSAIDAHVRKLLREFGFGN